MLARREQLGDPQLKERAHHGGHISVGPGPEQLERLLTGNKVLALQRATDLFDLILGQSGDVADRTTSDLSSLTPCFSNQDRGSGVTVGDHFNIHGNMIHQVQSGVKHLMPTHMETDRTTCFPPNPLLQNTLRARNGFFGGVTSA